MRQGIGGIVAAALLLAGGATARAQDAEVARGVKQIEQGDPQGGLETLDAAVRRLSTAPDAADELARAHLHMGIAYAALDQEKAAHASFREALQLRRQLTLDPQRFPRRTLRIFEEALRELPQESAAGRVARSVVRLRAGDGTIVASALVVDAAGHALTVLSLLPTDGLRALLPDGRQAGARIVGRDTLLNVALLALDAAPPPLELGDSDRLQVDAHVSAVSAGLAAGRPATGKLSERDPAGTFLVTDLGLDATASGSPLLDAGGNVVGLAMVVPADVRSPFAAFFPGAPGTRVLTTFAIPASALRAALPQLVALGRVRRGWLGLALKDIDEQEARRLKLGRTGALVTAVDPGSPAAHAGFLPGDQLVTVSGRNAFADSADAVRTIAGLAPGTAVDLLVTRPKTKRLHWLKATVGERPATP
jgi:S1-C subfamily serine protease